MTHTPIAIIGAGLSGLHAARLLSRANVATVLLEARDRLGGRILTVDEHGQPTDDGFDLGPSWYWPRMQPALAALITELGLEAFVQHSAGDVVFERVIRDGPQRYPGIGQEAPSCRLSGGTAALVRAVARDLAEETLRRSTRVTAMALRDDSVELTLAVTHPSGPVTSETLHAKRVIAALPPRLLEATVEFTPALEAATRRRWRDTPTWMAPHAKFFALYDRPFWRDAGLSGTAQSMVGPLAEVHDATTAAGRPALFGFLGLGAESRRALGESALAPACLDQLARLFGAEAMRPRATLLKDWAADDLTATAADHVAAGHVAPHAGPWVTGAWERRLVLGGSECSPTEPGYLVGAVESARLAVAACLAGELG